MSNRRTTNYDVGEERRWTWVTAHEKARQLNGKTSLLETDGTETNRYQIGAIVSHPEVSK